jgi:beta-glucosidase
MANNHLDTHYSPLFPFGFGMSFATFEYHNLRVLNPQMTKDESLKVSVDLHNESKYVAEEVVQVYIRDLHGSTTRPVKELKAFKRVKLNANSKTSVAFSIAARDLGFYGRDNTFNVEAGRFHVWLGGDSNAALMGEFEIV